MSQFLSVWLDSRKCVAACAFLQRPIYLGKCVLCFCWLYVPGGGGGGSGHHHAALVNKSAPNGGDSRAVSCGPPWGARFTLRVCVCPANARSCLQEDTTLQLRLCSLRPEDGAALFRDAASFGAVICCKWDPNNTDFLCMLNAKGGPPAPHARALPPLCAHNYV